MVRGASATGIGLFVQGVGTAEREFLMPRDTSRKSAARTVQRSMGMRFAAANQFASSTQLRLSPAAPHGAYLKSVSDALADVGLNTGQTLIGYVQERPVGFLLLDRSPLTTVRGIWELGCQWTMHEGVGWTLHGYSIFHDVKFRWAVGGADIVPAPSALACDVTKVFLERRVPYLPEYLYRKQTQSEAERYLESFTPGNC